MLQAAVREGEEFDPVSGEPESWRPAPDAVSTCAWARRWLGEQWPEWQPRTRVAALESLIRFVPLAVPVDAPAPPPGLRHYLLRALPPDGAIEVDSGFERWLGRWSLPLNRLDAEVLARVDQRLGVGDQGQPLAGSTANRYRRVAHSSIRRAVELRVLGADPWPPPPRGRNRRRANRPARRAELRRLPDPTTMTAAIAAMPNQYQPSSRMYQMMTAVAYYGGLRPSEVTVLRRSSLDLPSDGWGRIDVVAAYDLEDETADPKTGARHVPIPPQLVTMLQVWIDEHGFTGDDFVFRSRNGLRPTPSN
jgi:integrase